MENGCLILTVLVILFFLIIVIVAVAISLSYNNRVSGPGDECDATNECQSGLICRGGVCKIPVGSSCEYAEDYCAGTSQCISGVCLSRVHSEYRDYSIKKSPVYTELMVKTNLWDLHPRTFYRGLFRDALLYRGYVWILSECGNYLNVLHRGLTTPIAHFVISHKLEGDLVLIGSTVYSLARGYIVKTDLNTLVNRIDTYLESKIDGPLHPLEDFSRIKNIILHDWNNETGEDRCFDPTPPTAELFSDQVMNGGYYNQPITLTCQTSETTDLNQEAFYTTNCRLSQFTQQNLIYTMLVTPKNEGMVEVSLPAGSYSDASGNYNTQISSFKYTYDTTPPTATITNLEPSPTHSDMPFQLELSETGEVTDEALTLINGTLESFESFNSQYQGVISAQNQGTVSISLLPGSFSDLAGNYNVETAEMTYTYDSVDPSVSLTVETNPTNSPVTLTIKISEPTQNFTVECLKVQNGSVTDFSGSGSNYTCQVTGHSDGEVTVTVPAGCFTDPSGNLNTEGIIQYVYDTQPPQVTLSGPSTSQTAATITAVISESTQTFTQESIQVDNGAVSDFIGEDITYSFKVTPQSEGKVNITVPSGAFTDLAGNSNTSASFSFTYDDVAPDETLSSSDLYQGYTNTAVTIEVQTSETTLNLTLSDFEADNAEMSDFTGSGTNYTLVATPVQEGEVTVTLPAGSYTDATGNGNQETSLTFTYDVTPPIATFSGPDTVTDSVNVTCTVSETIRASLVKADFTLDNCQLDELSVEGLVYTLSLTPLTEGSFTITLLSDVCQDLAGNFNTEASLTIKLDSTSPTVAITSEAPDIVSSAIQITITLSEGYNDLKTSDFETINGTVSQLEGSEKNYTAIFTPQQEGLASIYLPADVYTDSAGNANLESNTFTLTLDTQSPTAVLTQNDLVITVVWSEAVNFRIDNLQVTGADVTDFTQVDSVTYTVSLEPIDDEVNIVVPAGVTTDAAGNLNLESNVIEFEYDIVAPTVTITCDEVANQGLTNVASLEIEVYLSDPAQLTQNDFTLVNGSISNLQTSNDLTYTLTFTSSQDGECQVVVLAGTFQDAMGNFNTQGSLIFYVDTSSPTATLSSHVTSGSVTSYHSINLTLNLSEEASISLNDFATSQATVDNLQGSGDTYTLELLPVEDGVTAEVYLKAEVFTDSAGNPNLKSNTLTFIADYSYPTVTITGEIENGVISNQSQTEIALNFSESITGLKVSDLEVTNGSLSNLSGSNKTYTATLMVNTPGLVSVYLPSDQVFDAAGNGNTKSNTYSYTYANSLFTFEADDNIEITTYNRNGYLGIVIINTTTIPDGEKNENGDPNNGITKYATLYFNIDLSEVNFQVVSGGGGGGMNNNASGGGAGSGAYYIPKSNISTSTPIVCGVGSAGKGGYFYNTDSTTWKAGGGGGQSSLEIEDMLLQCSHGNGGHSDGGKGGSVTLTGSDISDFIFWSGSGGGGNGSGSGHKGGPAGTNPSNQNLGQAGEDEVNSDKPGNNYAGSGGDNLFTESASTLTIFAPFYGEDENYSVVAGGGGGGGGGGSNGGTPNGSGYCGKGLGGAGSTNTAYDGQSANANLNIGRYGSGGGGGSSGRGGDGGQGVIIITLPVTEAEGYDIPNNGYSCDTSSNCQPIDGDAMVSRSSMSRPFSDARQSDIFPPFSDARQSSMSRSSMSRSSIFPPFSDARQSDIFPPFSDARQSDISRSFTLPPYAGSVQFINTLKKANFITSDPHHNKLIASQYPIIAGYNGDFIEENTFYEADGRTSNINLSSGYPFITRHGLEYTLDKTKEFEGEYLTFVL